MCSARGQLPLSLGGKIGTASIVSTFLGLVVRGSALHETGSNLRDAAYCWRSG